MMQGKRVALIGPRFFSYLEAVRFEFERRGVSAIAVDDIHSQSIFWRVIYRLGLVAIYGRKLRKYNESLIARLQLEGVCHIVFVNCETYDEKFLSECARLNIEVSVYFWDSVKNKPIFEKYIKNFRNVASFDPGDCEVFKLRYIPLFAERDFFENADQSTRMYDACMVATIHSSRSEWAKELYLLRRKGRNINVFAYFSSKLLFFIRNAFRPDALTLLPHIKSDPLSKRDVASLFKKSRHVVDVHHFKQRGLTSRTFEALAAGAKLVTTNRDVDSLPVHLRERTLIVSHPSEMNEVLGDIKPLAPLTKEDRYFLSIERFVDQLLALVDRNFGSEPRN